MIRFSKLALLAAATAAFTFTGCGEDTTPSDASNVGSVTCVANDINYTSHIGLRTFTEVCTIKGQFQDQNVTLDATKLYQLDGEVVIGGDNANPANLIIPANTVLFGGFGDFILISRGSQINATGTSTNPIIMTSAEDIIGDANASSRGQWGGLAIAGNGQINKGTEEAFEFSSIGRTFGGNDDADNSGVVEYVVIKHSGWEYIAGAEMQGLSLGGVGSGTTLSYINIYNSSDDGVEIWGGAAQLDHLVITGASDDSIDTDHGYRGTIQYVYVEQSGAADHILEADNEGSNYSATPRSHPSISNFTFISADADDALKWKEGTEYSLINGAITGLTNFKVIEMDVVATFDNFKENNASIMAGVDFVESNQTVLVTDLTATDGELLSNYLETVSVNCDITADITGGSTTTAVNPATYDTRFTATSSIGYTDGADWRVTWAIGVDGNSF